MWYKGLDGQCVLLRSLQPRNPRRKGTKDKASAAPMISFLVLYTVDRIIRCATLHSAQKLSDCDHLAVSQCVSQVKQQHQQCTSSAWLYQC